MPGALEAAQEGDTSGLVQEISLVSSNSPSGFLEAPVIAGCISAILLVSAIIICVCAVLSKRKFSWRNNTTTAGRTSIDCKEKPVNGIYSTSDYKRAASAQKIHSSQFGTSSKKKVKRGSVASLSTRNDNSNFEIYPYATFGTTPRLDADTYQYGLNLRSQTPGSRDCLDTASVEWARTDVYQSDDTDTYCATQHNIPTDLTPAARSLVDTTKLCVAVTQDDVMQETKNGPASTLRHHEQQVTSSKNQEQHQPRLMQPLPQTDHQYIQHNRPHHPEEIYQRRKRLVEIQHKKNHYHHKPKKDDFDQEL
ncbi:uncharacterized protein LOC125177833 [Hyalella azteca]|uniref:Uncharacterized protein LOC125177833 n=1 Tax=Hyalella azteca TaxID=294128 RepID=A0A979FI68_HYAAZ|nr:uncharacterized protein LOC125177833 [Hyalella azteca]